MPTARAKRLVITRGQGAWLTTSTGQRLLDATASLWHANIGHGRQRVAQAAAAQMTALETYHCFGRFANEPALRLADRLAAIGPIPGAKVLLTSGGWTRWTWRASSLAGTGSSKAARAPAGVLLLSHMHRGPPRGQGCCDGGGPG